MDFTNVKIDKLVPICENYKAFYVSEHLVRSSVYDFVFKDGRDRGAWCLGCYRWVGGHSCLIIEAAAGNSLASSYFIWLHKYLVGLNLNLCERRMIGLKIKIFTLFFLIF